MDEQEKEALPINEEARAKKCEHKQDRCSALPSDEKEEIRAKNREYQHSWRARLKAKAYAAKLTASSQITAQNEKARAKKMSTKERGMLHCLIIRRRKFGPKTVNTNEVVGLV
jgi:hypothetical protein